MPVVAAAVVADVAAGPAELAGVAVAVVAAEHVVAVGPALVVVGLVFVVAAGHDEPSFVVDADIVDAAGGRFAVVVGSSAASVALACSWLSSVVFEPE